MATIRKLDEEVIALIAAGEVVERPASVVKELVENSLDASASSIEISIQDGGRSRIVVADDGCGMTRGEVLLGLERHATSKIEHVEDLTRISTLGFRGEALPSIAAVSQLRIDTRPAQAEVGTRVEVAQGVIRDPEEVGCARGTRVSVGELFGRMPARRKFLRSAATETGRVHTLVTDLALAHPSVRVRLESQGRALVDVTPASGEDAERQRLGALLGRDVFPALFPFSGSENGVQVSGYFAAPTKTRRDTRGYHFFLHRRAIGDRALMHSVRRAYRSVLDDRRHPIVVVHLDIDREDVDVNVHPAKHEVRFQDTRRVLDAVAHTLAAALAKTPWVGSGRTYVVPHGPPAEVRDRADDLHAWHRARVRDALDRFAARAGSMPSVRERWEPPAAARENRENSGGDSGAPSTESATLHGEGYFSRLQVIGQALDTFLLCQHAGALVLIDQHAAHERVVFERLLARRRAGRPAGQGLLLPVGIEIDPRLLAAAEDNAETISSLGFELEPFGGDTLRVRAVPADLVGASVEVLVRDLLEELADNQSASPAEEAVERVCARLACHGSVRAGRGMRAEEIQALLRELDRVDFGAHCPHGRPVVRELSRDELAHLFERG